MNPLTSRENIATPSRVPGIAAKINSLHATARRLENESREKLDGAVAAAWQAGKLLLEAKASITRHGGRGAWTPWLKTMFTGGERTAQRYMKLAREIPAPDALRGLSLRQAYFRLGIATEPKQAQSSTANGGTRSHVGKLPPHIALANKLVRALRESRCAINPRDLAALYAQLRSLFEVSEAYSSLSSSS